MACFGRGYGRVLGRGYGRVLAVFWGVFWAWLWACSKYYVMEHYFHYLQNAIQILDPNRRISKHPVGCLDIDTRYIPGYIPWI